MLEDKTYDSKFGRKFKSVKLNKGKYEMLLHLAMSLRDFRNALSMFVWEDPMTYLNMSQTEFLKLIRENFEIKLHSNYDYDQIIQVHTDYQNRFNAMRRNIQFLHKKFVEIQTYKRKTKYHEKGDFKGVKWKKNSSPLTVCLTYLARYGQENTLDFIKNQLENNKELKEDKKKFYELILIEINKFGFERLFAFAMRKRKKMLEEYLQRDPVTYTSLTFGARSRKKVFIKYNDNFGQKINAFILLSFDGRAGNEIIIPVKYSKKFHGDMKLYNEKEKNFQYEISFDEKNKEVFVHYTVDGKRDTFDATEYLSLIGADVNIKHNMICLSDEIKLNNVFTKTLDYNRDLIDEFKKLLKKIEQNKKNNPNYKEGRRIRIERETLKNKMKKDEQEKIASMFEAMKNSGYNHLVLENLTGISGKCYSTTDDDINYANIIKFVSLSSLKNEMKRIGHKHGVAVSFVHSEYTSQMCPVCGHIHKNNRKT